VERARARRALVGAVSRTRHIVRLDRSVPVLGDLCDEGRCESAVSTAVLSTSPRGQRLGNLDGVLRFDVQLEGECLGDAAVRQELCQLAYRANDCVFHDEIDRGRIDSREDPSKPRRHPAAIAAHRKHPTLRIIRCADGRARRSGQGTQLAIVHRRLKQRVDLFARGASQGGKRHAIAGTERIAFGRLGGSPRRLRIVQLDGHTGESATGLRTMRPRQHLG